MSENEIMKIFEKEKFHVESVTEEELKDFIGLDGYKFVPIRTAIIEGKVFNWSWPIFFLGGVWSGYRKDWRQVFAISFCILVMGLLGLALAHILMGFVGSRRFVINSSKKITRIKCYESDPERLSKILSQKGGTSILSAFGSLVLLALTLLATPYLIQALSN